MSTFILESKRPGESDAEFEARSEAYWRRLEAQADKVRALREAHTGKVAPPKRRSV